MGSDNALALIGNVRGVVIESGEGTEHATHNRHRVRIAPETSKQEGQLVMDHGMARYGVLELLHLLGIGKIAVEKKVADLEKIGVGRQLVDRIAAVT